MHEKIHNVEAKLASHSSVFCKHKKHPADKEDMVTHPRIPLLSGKADCGLDGPISEDPVITLFSNNQKHQNIPAFGQWDFYTQWPT